MPHEEPVSLPSCSQRLTSSSYKEWKGNKWPRVFVLWSWDVLFPLVLRVFFFFFLLKKKKRLLTLSHAKTLPVAWIFLPSAGCFVALQSHAFPLYVSAPHSNFRLPVTLFTTSSSPMRARTVRDPASTCQKHIYCFTKNVTIFYSRNDCQSPNNFSL